MKNTEAEAACSDAREGVSRCKHSNYGGCVQRISYQQITNVILLQGLHTGNILCADKPRYGVEHGGFLGWIPSEEDAGEGAYGETHDDAQGREERPHLVGGNGAYGNLE